MSGKANPIDSLHRYFIWTDSMRHHFDQLIATQKDKLEFGSKEHIEINLYMSFWYGELYVVVEGWTELKLTDSTVDLLLQDATNVGLLRRYRNGAFHFQKDYFDDRFVDLMSKEGTIKWIRSLHAAFSAFFLTHCQAEKMRL